MRRFIRIQAVLLSIMLLSLSLAPHSLAAQFDPDQVQTADALIKAAREQVLAQKHTKLKSPAPYHFLIIAYTKVSYDNKTYTMTAAQKSHVYAVAENFKYSVEKAANYNVEIKINVEYVNTLLTIPKAENSEYIYIDKAIITEDLKRFNVEQLYDSVMTTSVVPETTAGVKTNGVGSSFGYGYFQSWDTIPIPDKTEPTSINTLFIIHEFLHQLEEYAALLDIKFPDVHAYAGAQDNPEYANYEVYEKDTVDDFWYFYRDILAGKILYKGEKYIGMYPKMWLITPQTLKSYKKTARISNVESGQYLVANGSNPAQAKTLKTGEGYWDIKRYGEQLGVSSMGMSLDIDNAWAARGNSVHLYPCWNPSDEYIDAQIWDFKEYEDGSFALHSKMDSSLVLTLNKSGKNLLTLEKEDGSARQRWRFELNTTTTHKVTFNTKISNTVKLSAVESGKTVKKPTGLSKKGYVFAGWYSDSACKKAFDFKTKIKKDTTVYAKWTAVKGSITPASSSVKKNKTLKLKATGNATIKSVKWTTSNKKIISLSGASKVQCTIKGLQKGKKATIKAVITFKDGTKKTVSRSIKVT